MTTPNDTNGRPFGRYQVYEQIGSGALAVVYQAENVALKKLVALKLLNPSLFHDPALNQHFINEARTAARLQHERIVRVLDLGEVEGQLFMALEYLPGGNLQDQLEKNQGRLPFRQVAQTASDVAEALDYAHSQGIVHGDVKPNNILLDANGRAKLADFGFLQAIMASRASQSDPLYGTAYYISPEQAAGRPPGPPSDQYALGVVIYELLTGRVPFEADHTLAVYLKHQREEPPAMSQWNPLITPQLEAVVLKTLAKEPAKRYASCGELARELRAAVAATETEQFQKLMSQAEVALTAHRPEEARPLLQDALLIMPDEPQARALRERLEVQERAQRTYATAARQLQEARQHAQELRADQPDQADPEGLLAQLTPPPPPRWRQWYGQWRPAFFLAVGLFMVGLLVAFSGLIYTGTAAGQPAQSTLVAVVRTSTPTPTHTATPTNTATATPTSTNTPTSTPTPTFTPTPTPTPLGGGSGQLAFVANYDGDGNGEIYVMDADGGNQTRLTNNSNRDYQPAWSPDGRQIAFFSDRDGNGEIYVMDADGGNQARLTNNLNYDYQPAWSPDGRQIAFSSNRDGNYEIYVMNAGGGNQTRLTNNSNGDDQPAWSPDGRQIAFRSHRDGNGEIYVMDADGGNQTRLTNNSNGDYQPAWSPDGRQIAFSSYRDVNYEIYVMDADGGNQTRLTNNSASDYNPAWSPDGRLIAFISERDGRPEIYLMNSDGTDLTRLTNSGVTQYSTVAWRP